MTREDAIINGHKHYNGRPCKRCGDTLKFVSSQGCVSCTQKRTNQRDPEVYKRYIKSDKGQEWMKEFRRSETYRSIQNRWSVNSGYHREQQARRRKQMRETYETLSESDRARIKEVYAECARLSCETGIMHHVDHIVPLFEGGQHHPDNLQILTFEEHMQKCSSEQKRRQK